MRLLVVCGFTVLPSATAALVISLLKFLVLAVLLVSTTVLCLETLLALFDMLEERDKRSNRRVHLPTGTGTYSATQTAGHA
ncbi:hypothetical protein PF003_g7605 [Phytophthora fragariae]|nr:hypothetical protein PF003_g7605 [Phytophthora fragariae]